MDSQYPGCLGQAVVTSRLLCAIVESPRRHVYAPFVNITSLRSRSIKRRQWKHKLDYYGVVFAHLATGRGINAKDPSGLDSDRWIPHSRCCENPARAKALAGFSRHLSAGFTDLNPAPRGLSLYNSKQLISYMLNIKGNICFYIIWFINSEMPQVIESPSSENKDPSYPPKFNNSISGLLMALRPRGATPWHQWYWLRSSPGTIRTWHKINY